MINFLIVLEYYYASFFKALVYLIISVVYILPCVSTFKFSKILEN